jgi:hypothetical protein
LTVRCQCILPVPEEVRSYLRMAERLHVLFGSVNAASRLLEPDNVDSLVGGSACVFAGEVGVEALGSEDKQNVDYT